MTDNIDEFNADVGVILAKLYESFPAPVDLSMQNLAGSADPAAQQHWFDTVKWLADEGYLRFSTYLFGMSFARVVLSQRGIAILGEHLSSLKESPTFGARLREIAKSGGKELLIPLVRDLLVRGAQSHFLGPGTI